MLLDIPILPIEGTLTSKTNLGQNLQAISCHEWSNLLSAGLWNWILTIKYSSVSVVAC